MGDDIIREQLRFFSERRAGCLFAAVAARDPVKYGWVHQVSAGDPAAEWIDSMIEGAVSSPQITTLSLLLPTIKTTEGLVDFVSVLKGCRLIDLAQVEDYADSVCLGFRTLVGSLRSYVTGFGNFPFLPITRQAPVVEITMRVKPRPKYEFVFKEAPPNIVHLADMDMVGMQRDKLWELWNNSFIQTEMILGAKPDLRSAARTTYSLPERLFHNVR